VDITSSIKRAVLVFRDHAELDDADVVSALVRDGVETELAERLVEFLPLAFYRAMVPSRPGQFADHYVRMAPDGSASPDRKLAKEPVYIAAMKEARAELASGTSREEYELIAGRSSEAAAVNDLLQQGGSVANAIFSPPVFLRWVDENKAAGGQWSARKWWQFWK